MDASDAERRRIARDLHDGVVQDLAGSAFALAAASREPSCDPATAARLSEVSGSVRTSLRGLRSLLVEIYPPDLREGLAAAVEDLLAKAGSAVRPSVRVDGLAGVSENTVALVWRVAQEAVRNALRHAQPGRVEVSVASEGDLLVLEVHDDGVGFDPALAPETGHLGLRALHDLIREAGGRLQVDSAPGAGTTVRLEVERR